MSTATFDDAAGSRAMLSERAVFFGALTLIFAASAALTIGLCVSMAAMDGMPMPGGWTMSMMWMRMPGQSGPGAAVSFLGMWIAMMIAMMLPSLAPVLWRCRRLMVARWIALVGVAYFFVWTIVGIGVFATGTTLATLAMQHPALARAVPAASGVVVLVAGALQLTRWKRRQLACCRDACDRAPTVDARGALRHGLRLGMHCAACCAGLTATLLVLGVMDLGAMAIVTAAITAERLAPAGERVARAIGVVAIAAGLFLIARAAGFA